MAPPPRAPLVLLLAIAATAAVTAAPSCAKYRLQWMYVLEVSSCRPALAHRAVCCCCRVEWCGWLWGERAWTAGVPSPLVTAAKTGRAAAALGDGVAAGDIKGRARQSSRAAALNPQALPCVCLSVLHMQDGTPMDAVIAANDKFVLRDCTTAVGRGDGAALSHSRGEYG